MSINISGYKFDGPFTNTSDLYDLSGVYVILGNYGVGNWDVVDVGESATLKSRVSNHDRKVCWQAYSNISVAVCYVDEVNRESIATQVRQEYNPPCGEK